MLGEKVLSVHLNLFIEAKNSAHHRDTNQRIFEPNTNWVKLGKKPPGYKRGGKKGGKASSTKLKKILFIFNNSKWRARSMLKFIKKTVKENATNQYE